MQNILQEISWLTLSAELVTTKPFHSGLYWNYSEQSRGKRAGGRHKAMRSPPGALSFKSHSSTKPSGQAKGPKTKITETLFPMPGHQLTEWGGRRGTGWGNNTDQKARHSALRKGHLAFHRNSIIIHFTAVTFMKFTSVEEEQGVEVRRLFLENKGNIWAGVSTCS